MAVIRADSQGKIQQAQKRLRKNVHKLKDADNMSPAQREALQTRALIDLHHIEMWRLGRFSEVE